MGATGARYAIYYAPSPDDALWTFGSAVLGYDAGRGEAAAMLCPEGFSIERWMVATEEPRRYGFHATLKPPFYLAEERTEAQLLAATAALAGTLSPAPLRLLAVRTIGNFIAIVPAGDSAEVQNFAEKIVRDLDGFRAPLPEADRQRRLSSALTPRQIELLDHFGYPYVLEQFRFHMTLSGPLDAPERGPATAALHDLFTEKIGASGRAIDQIVVFRQDSREGQFRIIARYPTLV